MIIKTIIFAVVLLLVFTRSMLAFAEPIVESPRFERLSTENGLTQDFINDMLVDSDGLLWIATATGLNRYDGHDNKHFTGLENEFADDGIYSLYQDKNNDLWVSTYSRGVFRVDYDTGKSKRELSIKYKNQPTWQQYASHFIEGPANSIFIAFDHVIVQFDLGTNEWTTIFELLAPEFALNDDAIIRRINYHDGVLIIATSVGLYTYNESTQKIKKASYLADKETNKDKLNGKLLLPASNDELWLGTVEGLFKISLSSLIAFAKEDLKIAPLAEEIIPSLNIWSMAHLSGADYYIATDKGLYTFNLVTKKLKHLFLPSDSNLLITDDDITNIAFTPDKRLWLATDTSGVLLWDPKTLAFQNVFSDGKYHNQLSNNIVYDFHVQDEENLWVGTHNGLNWYSLSSGDMEQFLVTSDAKAVESSGTIYIIREGKGSWVWLVTSEGLTKFDLNTKQVIPLGFDEETNTLLSSGKANDILHFTEDKFVVVTEDKFYRLDIKNNKSTQDEVLTASLNPSQFYTFLPEFNNEKSSVLISMTGALWRYNFITSSLTKVHEARNVQAEYVISPTEAIIDDFGTLWISYPGHGLYGIDATTYEHKHFFDSSNLLPTNIVFSLIKDDHGMIWMGSHQGLLQLNPSTLRLKQFTIKEGLTTNEFTWGGRKALLNHNLVFGSQKGFTLFDPSDFNTQTETLNDVFITDIRLISKDLELGLGIQNDKSIVLSHDDIGLSINYSDMQYTTTKFGKYKYELAGAVNVSYPPTNLTEVSFPQLDPGEYTFSVASYDPASDVSGPKTRLKIKVQYPLFASPFAYFLYAFIALTLSMHIMWRRKLNRENLQAAHLDALENKNRLTMALKASNANIWEWQEDSNLITQERIESELGYERGTVEPTLKAHLSLIHPHDITAFTSKWQAVTRGERKNIDITYRLKARDGRYIWFRDVGALVLSEVLSQPKRLAGTYSNIDESINTQTKAQLFGEAFEHTRDWVVIFDTNFKPVIANNAFKEALDIASSENITDQLESIFSEQRRALHCTMKSMRKLLPGEHWSGEAEISSISGRRYEVNIGITAVCNSQATTEISRYLVILSDITKQKHAQDALVQLANYDSLTGLPNRTLLLDRVQHAFEQASRDHSSLCLFFIDLDRFKQINDSLGHEAGDTLLQIIGKRIEKILRKSDTVARLGGDEFVVMIEKIEAEKDIAHLANQMIIELARSVTLKNQIVSVSASIGIALYPDDASTPTELLKNADIAMYHAKELGSNNFQYFTEHMNERAQTKLKLENAVKQACSNNEFVGFYQPIVHTASGAIAGFELLMRWPSKDGMTPPDVFIPVAESIGIIEAMTLQVLEKALPLLKTSEWMSQSLYLSINLSALHISKPAKIQEVVELLNEYNIASQVVRFEITESALMSDYEGAMNIISSLKNKGFVIALDDFGTGYSSLKYLKDFPIDILKIDKSFVDDVGKGEGNEGIVLAILRMAESLNISCIAEGIETQQQVDFFKAHDCEFLQGYHFSKPIDGDSLRAMLINTSPP